MSESKYSAKYLLPEIDLSKYNLGTIYHLKVSDVIKLEEIQEIKLEEFLYPFLINLTEENNDINLFDSFFIEDRQARKIFFILLESLKIFYKTDKVKVCKDKCILINSAKIDRNNFNILCNTIREMFFLFKLQEKTSRNIQVSEENKALLEEYLILEKEYEMKKQEQNNEQEQTPKTLQQIITIVSSMNQWNYDMVLDMSYYRFWNTFSSIMGIENYKTYIKYASSGNFDMKDREQKHWTEIVGV